MEMGVGIDVGSTTTKGVLLDSSNKIVAKSLMLTGASAVQAVQKTLQDISSLRGTQ